MSEPPPKGESNTRRSTRCMCASAGAWCRSRLCHAVQYSSGIIRRLHTRAAAGMFDVSHMGQIALRPRSGRVADAARALEALLPARHTRAGAGAAALHRANQRQRRHSRRPDGGESR